MADLNAASNQINLAAVKRVDPYARDILEKASQVALYTFNGDTNEWKKTDVEGALFVYSRTGEPYHNIVILNRLNTNNLVEPVVPGLDIQRQEPFLLYRNTQCKIFGIWFYDKEECVTIAGVLHRLVMEASGIKQPQQPPPPPQQQPVNKAPATVNIINNNNVNDNGVDIFTLLSKAQKDYHTVKATTPPQGAPVGPQTAETPQTVLEFFAKASSSSKKQPVAQPPGMIMGQHPGQRLPTAEGNDPNLKPILQRLMSNPVHSVEHIEKQQRSVTPQQAEAPPPEKKSSQKEQKRSSFKLKPLKENGKQNAPQAHVISNTPNQASVITNGLNFMRLSPSSTGAVSGVLQSPRTPGGPVPLVDTRPDATPKQALMPPVMFTSSVEASQQPGQQAKSGFHFGLFAEPPKHPGESGFQLGMAEPKQPGGQPGQQPKTNFHLVSLGSLVEQQSQSDEGIHFGFGIPKPKLPGDSQMSSLADELSELASRQATGARSPPPKLEPLTKNQLLQAFHYLLKNDPDFVNTLHEAYVKSFAEIVP